jgi:hypothetical protein
MTPLKAPNRLKSLKLTWRFVLTSCHIYQNPFTYEKILKFWQYRTKKHILRIYTERSISIATYELLPHVLIKKYLTICQFHGFIKKKFSKKFLTIHPFGIIISKWREIKKWVNELFCGGFIELTTYQIFFHQRHTERSSKATAIGFFIDLTELGETLIKTVLF